tara:strand:+ start:93 stop:407 length:315 start_codon:yes stop_codon:yes gene_type:complete
MKRFVNFKSAHNFYKYPSTHRIGTIYNKNGVIRSYSNNTIDKYNNDYSIFYYKLKNDDVKSAFKLTKNKNNNLRLFIKQKNYVLDLGLYKVSNVGYQYVKLIKI